MSSQIANCFYKSQKLYFCVFLPFSIVPHITQGQVIDKNFWSPQNDSIDAVMSACAITKSINPTPVGFLSYQLL